jgi:CHAD domain-containing protein
MAKAREIPNLSAEDPYGVAAARVVEIRAQELVDHSARVLDVADIERVHDMRVATRRLRAALEVFEPCFPRRRLKATLREVKELADALGERRDRDVAIESLQGFAAAISAPDRPGIDSLVERFRAEQRSANEGLAPFVLADRLDSLHRRLRELAADARANAGDPAEIARHHKASPDGAEPAAADTIALDGAEAAASDAPSPDGAAAAGSMGRPRPGGGNGRAGAER